jgi:hypothetical protein
MNLSQEDLTIIDIEKKKESTAKYIRLTKTTL